MTSSHDITRVVPTALTALAALAALSVLAVPAAAADDGVGAMPLASVIASEADCAETSRIVESFDNGARWEMCLESRTLENIVFKHVTYTPPDGEPTSVLAAASLAQLHVAYDDSDITYNDVTEYGLGAESLVPIDEADCPYGTIVEILDVPTLCRWLRTGGDGYRSATRAVETDTLNLFSVSQIGAYTYIQSWTFHDDGAIEPGVGATGALQRAGSDITLPFGRVLEGDDEHLWLSHTHNYYWRLDFDIGHDARDDVVVETRFPLAENGRRTPARETYLSERARLIEPALLQSWHIGDSGGRGPGYRIEPLRNGHHFERTAIEPYTAFDIFVTRARDCERFASQNARFNPECANDVLQFADAESLVGEDIVFWHRVGFHHVPRNEDQRHMHAHWDGFVIEPVGVHARTPGTSADANSPPVLAQYPARTGNLGDDVADEQLRATDADGDSLWFDARNLPDGLALGPTGLLEGRYEAAGEFEVAIRVDDGQSRAESTFLWRVIDPSNPDGPTGDGDGSESNGPDTSDSGMEGGTAAGATSTGNTRRRGGGSTGFPMLLLAFAFLMNRGLAHGGRRR